MGFIADDDEWVDLLWKHRGWSLDIIRKYNLRKQTLYKEKETGILKPIYKNRVNRVAIPIEDAAGRIVNIRPYRFMPAPEGSMDNKIFSWSSGTGSTMLFPAKPEREDEPVLLCEGESDCLCALSHLVNSMTQTSKPKNWLKEQLEVFRDKDVIIAFDADIAGQKYALEFAAPALVKVARSVKILEWPDFMGRLDSGQWPNDHGQDLTDFFVRHRKTKADLDELIAKASPYNCDDHEDYTEEEIDSQALDFFVRGVNDRLSFKARRLAERLCEMVKLLSDPESGLLYKWLIITDLGEASDSHPKKPRYTSCEASCRDI